MFGQRSSSRYRKVRRRRGARVRSGRLAPAEQAGARLLPHGSSVPRCGQAVNLTGAHPRLPCRADGGFSTKCGCDHQSKHPPSVISASPAVRRYSAFSTSAAGGNPAGVVMEAADLSDDQMQSIASDVGYSETAFLTGPITAGSPIPIRYFAPVGEVDFCGHATIATAVALGEDAGLGAYTLHTKVGPVNVRASRDRRGFQGSLESPPISCSPLAATDLELLLSSLRWTGEVLHPDYLPGIGFGGNLHPVVVVRDAETLGTLDYHFAALQELCRTHTWITVTLIAPAGPGLWQARNPFPWGGVVEDPATGAAAAAFAGYLRAQGRIAAGASFTIRQGIEMGRPSTLEVTVLEATALISGYAAVITQGVPGVASASRNWRTAETTAKAEPHTDSY
ncbi:phenazine biosynthesis protein PhzF [Arthrobacter sp. Bz4]|nr:phenazine biosynthesis protein PhzF [Arthrobacter sp. Bz4]